MAVGVDIPINRQGPELEGTSRDMTVELIRARVEREEYVVDAEKVANAIIRRLLASIESEPAPAQS